jgi:hypothetical protein
LFYDDTATPVEPSSLVGASFDARAVAAVAGHVARFGASGLNEGMLDRLRRIANGSLAPSDYDARFLAHETRELQRYIARGWATGIPEDGDDAHHLWNTEHTCSLEDYGVHEKRFPLHHPDVEEMNEF